MVVSPLVGGRSRAPPGGLVPSVFLLRDDAERDAAVERQDFNLDVESFAVGVRPVTADAGPESLAALAVADVVGDVRRGLRGGRRVGVGVGHGGSPFPGYGPRPSRPD